MIITKKLTNIIFNIIIITILFILSYLIYIQYTKTKPSLEPSLDKFKDTFTCTMNLENINPKFADEFMKYDGRHVACGPCQNATLKINVNTSTDNSNPIQTAQITSSNGVPIIFPFRVNIDNIKTFFCFE